MGYEQILSLGFKSSLYFDNFIQLILFYARSIVTDIDFYIVFLQLYAHYNFAAFRGELDGVVHQGVESNPKAIDVDSN